MANTFLLKIITPGREVYNDQVEKVTLKSADGEFQVLANHQSLISTTIPCIAKFKDAKGNDEELFISKSLVQVNNNEMVISSDAAEFEEDIDEERAERALRRAEDRLKNSENYNRGRAEAAFFRAKQRLALKKSNR
ncbi:ATP synthase F1 subunit epsilon [Clostridium beijerinckii]|uniref:ATP synthase epsilon chain n=2 Tax=Clostridium TaxID=1485 RepID=A0A1S8STQ5_CLOBE|nr:MULTISPECIES: ATP synthase F1 subunit epsilon [Clostridium]MBA8937372.1 F-type H+-transporting ATPase subunit epsilon [Clostridium beijerinckii]MBN7574693.1 ATP synthase F1 subunit epsilon [Clostridium beijerinckii]MBN7579983.1 ATP synthase F1 subunit epsilon [Clostridium beijerinckii]MBN7584458.1 ATP synthase F1 subunit epsilon [Clostridium beijerinckii]MZK53065.1 ATP synthase F1 subunit epsilon [Clostridium beijerinckii]